MSTGKSAASWTMKKIVRPQSLALRMADQIRELIVSGEIELGTLISENDIASKLQVSRTPVREALQKLETERLVQIIPQRGTYVFQFNEQEMQQTCKMREILESGALGIALARDREGLIAALEKQLKLGNKALNGDPDSFRAADASFHMALIEFSQNQELIYAYHNIINRIRALLNRLARTTEELSGSQKDHEDFVAMLREGRDADAEQHLRWHVGGLLRMFQQKY
jgi:DNA-binding GntR family transcriptional regulator